MTQIQHLPYRFDDPEVKCAQYEERWKEVAIEACQSLFPRSGAAVLDFGAGRGELSGALAAAGFRVTAVDSDPECVRLTSQYCLCHLASTPDELRKLFDEESFDVVVALHVLEHLRDPLAYLDSLKALTRRYLILGVPNLGTMTRICFRRIVDVNRGHLQGWDYPTFYNFLTAHGGLSVLRSVQDLVVMPKLSNLLHRLKLRRLFEEHILPRLFPYQTNSVIALCEKRKAG